jgi:DAK2 domain fusion protein YloV
LANSLELGVNVAYKAVMKPTEGTILTVARVAAAEAHESLKQAEIAESIETFWEHIVKTADKTLQATPEMLPILKKAGVVDAGGMGLVLIWREMLEVFKGGEVKKPLNLGSSNTSTVFETVDDEEITFTYCTEFIIKKADVTTDESALRAYLETIGDSAVVVPSDDIIKVHVHTDHPGNALEKALKYGCLSNIKIDNMRLQQQQKIREAKTATQALPHRKPEKPYGFVAVSMGRGIDAIFKDLGADVVVSGGQTMNPSTENILEAIHATPAETVFVLPNNKNIILAAEQAIKLADRTVCVLQTRSIPQGISALMAFNNSTPFIQNRINMTKAFEKISAGHITFAARDLDYDGTDIKKGEILALDNTGLLFTTKDVTKACIKLTKKLITHETQFVTLLYGIDVTDESAEKTAETLRQKYPKLEIMLISGGQPLYYYIISAE